MTYRQLLLVTLLLIGSSLSVTAQAIRFPAASVTLRTTPQGITLSGLRTPEGELPPLSLQATIPAVTDETRIVIGGRDSDRPVKSPTVRTFIGHVGDDRQSTVTITYVGENLFGLIQLSDGTTWIVTRNLEEETYGVMSGADQFTLPDCGYRDEGSLSDVKGSPAHPASTGLRELELAVETDSEFFTNTGGDEQKAVDYLAALMSSVSSIYQKELGVVIRVVWARVWTDAPSDPYGVAGNPFALSDTIIANWRSYDTVERDLFHAITASDGGGGGYAFHDAICRSGSHAHGATSLQGWTDLSAPGFNYDIYIVSHEIGHNFNARHTHSCYYGLPLDTCEVEQGIQEGCLQQGQAKLPNPGSIMSYCGWTNLGAGFGYTVAMTFRDTVRLAMASFSTTLDCLSEVVPPSAIILYPDGDTVAAGEVTLTWSSPWTGDYELEMRGDRILSRTVSTTSDTVDLPSGTYEWRVRTVNGGERGPWTSWAGITVSDDITGVEEDLRGVGLDLW